MKKAASIVLILGLSAILLFISGCAADGYHYEGFTLVLDDPCVASYLNKDAQLSVVNAHAGFLRGVPYTVKSFSNIGNIPEQDVAALGIPGTNVCNPQWGCHGNLNPNGFSCYATAHFTNGASSSGILFFVKQAGRIDYGWLTAEDIASDRAKYAADAPKRAADEKKREEAMFGKSPLPAKCGTKEFHDIAERNIPRLLGIGPNAAQISLLSTTSPGVPALPDGYDVQSHTHLWKLECSVNIHFTNGATWAGDVTLWNDQFGQVRIGIENY